ncbi:MAG: quercetin dioxygenase-like cupin family protein [Parasphingorhabdus sp.]|jgi:quercetin dioxygenase-like cupin family protein
MNEQEFREKLNEKGYSEPIARKWEPNLDKEMHAHDKSAMAFVTEGVLTIVYESDSFAYGPGESCELLAGTLHTEKTGPEGATSLLAYK